jgi:hypothetical protein
MVQLGLGYPVDWGHAASAATRLISASNLIFHSQQKIMTSAYYFEMTSEVLEMGMKISFSHILLSVNVMASATIHSVPLDKMLHRNTKKKGDAMAQPTRNNPPHAPPQTHSELPAAPR